MTDPDIDAFKQRIMDELREWAEQSMIGQVATGRTLALFEIEICRRIARRVGCAPVYVQLRNLRVEDNGQTIAWDGFDIVEP